MADKKITQLDALASVTADDVFLVVDDPSGTPTSKKVTAANLATYTSTGLATTASLSTYAPLDSPTLTGTPAAPTASVGTSTTQIATTAFVMNSSDDDQFVLSAAIFTS
jgi:hypothetical protein